MMPDWDGWRKKYPTMTWKENVEFHDEVGRQFPNQSYFSAAAARIFFNAIGKDAGNVFEVGGWDGELASSIWDLLPLESTWDNYEVCRVIQPIVDSERFVQIIPSDFVWNLPMETFSKYRTFVSSHTIEHITMSDLKKLVRCLYAVKYVHVQAPLRDAPISWNDFGGTHIFEGAWPDVVSIFEDVGFKPMEKLCLSDTRCFQK